MTDTPEEVTAHRDRLAAERGISDEDRDILMTGTTTELLQRQADRLAPLPDVNQGNRAPREGGVVQKDPGGRDRQMTAFLAELFDQPVDPLDY